MPEGALEQKVRFLVFNIALKKANWAWAALIRLNLLAPLFRAYWFLLGRLPAGGEPASARARARQSATLGQRG